MADVREVLLDGQLLTRLETVHMVNARKKKHIHLFTDLSRLPLVRVIIGPARDQARNEALARKVVGNKVEIARSPTPYIV